VSPHSLSVSLAASRYSAAPLPCFFRISRPSAISTHGSRPTHRQPARSDPACALVDPVSSAARGSPSPWLDVRISQCPAGLLVPAAGRPAAPTLGWRATKESVPHPAAAGPSSVAALRSVAYYPYLPEGDIEAVASAVEHYSRRKLTEQPGRMNAFQGIFRHYRGKSNGRGSAFSYGLPVWV